MKNIMILTVLLFSMHVSADDWNEVEKIVSFDRETEAEFASSVSTDGNYVIIGAPKENYFVTTGIYFKNAGAAYIYKIDSAGNLSGAQKITASDYGANDRFGKSVSIDGDYAIVGAYLEDEGLTATYTLESSGSVYIFKIDSSGVWTEVQKIAASNRYQTDVFGWSVSISGEYAIVGAPGDGELSPVSRLIDFGSAYIFKINSSGVWHEVQNIVASDKGSFANFGQSVSIDGDYAIVGAYYESKDDTGGNALTFAGAAYIFERDSSGVWTEVQKLVSSDRDVFDNFGISVSISGNYAIVGDYRDGDDVNSYGVEGGNYMPRAGSAYLFERDSTGNWTKVQKMVACFRGVAYHFGYSVSISGNYAIVGAYAEGPDSTGAAYIFERDSAGHWGGAQRIVASDHDNDDNFGQSVAISSNYAIIGAHHEDESGSAYVFNASASTDTSSCYPTDVGISDNAENISLLIYPNPTQSRVRIKYSNKTGGEVVLRLVNLNGTVMHHADFDEAEIYESIDLSNFTKGMYFLQVTNDQTSINKKIVLQ